MYSAKADRFFRKGPNLLAKRVGGGHNLLAFLVRRTKNASGFGLNQYSPGPTNAVFTEDDEDLSEDDEDLSSELADIREKKEAVLDKEATPSTIRLTECEKDLDYYKTLYRDHSPGEKEDRCRVHIWVHPDKQNTWIYAIKNGKITITDATPGLVFMDSKDDKKWDIKISLHSEDSSSASCSTARTS